MALASALRGVTGPTFFAATALNRSRIGPARARRRAARSHVQVLRLGFNLVKVGNFQQRVLGDQGFLRLVHLEEFPARVRDTRSADLCLEKDATLRVRWDFLAHLST